MPQDQDPHFILLENLKELQLVLATIPAHDVLLRKSTLAQIAYIEEQIRGNDPDFRTGAVTLEFSYDNSNWADREPVFELPDIDDFCDALAVNPILVVSCEHRELLSDAYHQISKKLSNNLRHRQVLIPPDEEEVISFYDILSGLAKEPHRPDSAGVVTFVDIDERNVASLTNTISDPSIATFKDHLLRQNRFIVCLLETSVLGGESLRGSAVGYWGIDFLLPLLNHLGGQGHKTKPQTLVNEIHEQRLQKLWPLPQRLFYDEVVKVLGGDYHQLVKEVMNRPKQKKDSEQEKIDIRQKSPVNQAVYFVGTIFEPMSLHGFDAALKPLLSGLTHSEPAEDSEGPWNGNWIDRQETLDGHWVDRAAPTEMDAYEYWRNNSDKILGECEISAYVDGNGKRCLGFTRSWFRDFVKRQIEETMPMFQFQKIEQLLNAGLMFSPSTPRELVTQLVALRATAAEYYPEGYKTSWLLEMVGEIEKWFPEVPYEEQGQGTPRDVVIARNLGRFFAEKSRDSQFFYSRLSDVCKELIARAPTRQTVNVFLGKLASGGKEALGILLGLARRLRRCEGIDYFKWIKHCIEGGIDGDRRRIFFGLVREAQDPQQFDVIARKMLQWHPPESVPNLSQSQKYSLAFLFEYFHNSRDYDREYLEFHPIFPEEVRCSPERVQQRAELISAWMLHPLFSGAVDAVFREKRNLPENANTQWINQPHLIIHMLEWWIITADQSAAAGNPAAREACDVLVSVIADRCDSVLKRGIYEECKSKVKQYLAVLEQYKRKTELKSRRKQLLQRKRIVLWLRSRINQVQVTASETVTP